MLQLIKQWVHACRKIIPLAAPMAGTQLITMASSFLCMAMLAKLGHLVLAASALIYSVNISIILIGMSLLFSVSILVGHAQGTKDYIGIGSLLQQSWMLALLISLPIMLIFWYITPILIFLGQDKTISHITGEFFHANIGRVAPILLAVCNQQLCYGVQKQKIDLYSNIAGVVILLLASYGLIFGAWGLPKLGVAGFGYAMALQAIFYLLCTTICLAVMDDFKKYALFRLRIRQTQDSLKHLIKTGWPISVQISGEVLWMTAMATMVGWISTAALAAFQVVIQYLFLTLIPMFALSQASGILVSNALGTKQLHELKDLGNATFSIALITGLVTAVVFLGWPTLLAKAFFDVHNPENQLMLHLTIVIFAITAVWQIFEAIRNAMTGALRGLFDMRYPMAVGLIVVWLLEIPLGYVLAFPLHWGVVGISWASVVAMTLGAVLIVKRWQRQVSLRTQHNHSSH